MRGVRRAAWTSPGTRLSDAFRLASAFTRPGPPPLRWSERGSVADAPLSAARGGALSSLGRRVPSARTFFESVTLVGTFRRAASPRAHMPALQREWRSSLRGALSRHTQDESASALTVYSGGSKFEEDSSHAFDLSGEGRRFPLQPDVLTAETASECGGAATGRAGSERAQPSGSGPPRLGVAFRRSPGRSRSRERVLGRRRSTCQSGTRGAEAQPRSSFTRSAVCVGGFGVGVLVRGCRLCFGR